VTGITGVPFKVSLVPNGCLPGAASCGGSMAPDYYALRFDTGSTSAVVPMGSTEMLSGTTGGIPLELRNLRSYYDGACDAYWSFGWFAVPAVLRD